MLVSEIMHTYTIMNVQLDDIHKAIKSMRDHSDNYLIGIEKDTRYSVILLNRKRVEILTDIKNLLAINLPFEADIDQEEELGLVNIINKYIGKIPEGEF